MNPIAKAKHFAGRVKADLEGDVAMAKNKKRDFQKKTKNLKIHIPGDGLILPQMDVHFGLINGKISHRKGCNFIPKDVNSPML